MTPDIKKVAAIIEQAGRDILMPGFEKQATALTKDDGSVVTETDFNCQNFLQQKLATLAPDIGFLGEEMTHKEQLSCLQSGERFWCVDPLDGTSNFATPMPLFATSVALIENENPILACIHDPIRYETFTAIKGQGFQLNFKPHHQSTEARQRLKLNQSVGFVDFKRLKAETAIHLATKKIYRSQRNLGSCALEWAWLAAGRAQFIIHGGEKLWDYAAGCLLVEESGCVTSDFNHQNLFHISQLTSSIVASAHENLHTELLKALQLHMND